MPGEPDARIPRLVEGAAALGVDLEAAAAIRLVAYLDHIYEANKRLNLSRIEPAAALERHLVDSLAGLRVLGGLASRARIIDVGSGAGFPGVALAAARPAWQVTLLDAVRKKLRAVAAAAAAAGIANVATAWGRAEEFGRAPGFREAFDAAVARAVAPLPVLLELTLPFVRREGLVLAYKGDAVEDEVTAAAGALQVLGGELAAVDRFTLPWSGAGRSIVVIRKVRDTPGAYPRRPGQPARRPLGVGAAQAGPVGQDGRGDRRKADPGELEMSRGGGGR